MGHKKWPPLLGGLMTWSLKREAPRLRRVSCSDCRDRDTEVEGRCGWKRLSEEACDWKRIRWLRLRRMIGPAKSCSTLTAWVTAACGAGSFLNRAADDGRRQS